MNIINRTVWVLSFVSLFADLASEMLYPVVPIYLKEIGFSVLLIGVLEGVAECTAGLSKGYFGKRSDERGLRLPFIKWGYGLSALSKPMMALWTFPLWIFFARAIDRLGKGFRSAPRDALLSQNATAATKARVFGFHRSMDTLGAVAGPLVALLFLHFFPRAYAPLFYLALIPGLLSVALIFLLKEERKPVSTLNKKSFFSFFRYWNIASPEYRKGVAGLLLFALFNASDVFLLLKTREVTGSDTATILAYVFYNAVFAAAAYPMGSLADRLGTRKVLITGFLLFAAVYALFGLSRSPALLFAAFFLYGMYAACTEGVAKAWITNMAHDQDTATAVGFYTSAQSVATLAASILAGALWSLFGSSTPFLVTAVMAVGTALYFGTVTDRN